MTRYHLAIDEGDIAPTVLMPGDPGRVPIIAALWDDARHVATNREYVTYSGTYKGVPISCTSTGIGAPSTSIAMEELARCGARTFIRVGTCGTFQDEVNNGDMYSPMSGCSGLGKILPIVEFDHGNGRCAVTGGYV